ncbi:hypothetical protein [Asticcacaulis sp. YBE204]|uniref:hypothetical protein n=1 Tax=Asticcacaulis sp. YBE204 TaxID=1282363 RepID=UPI0003C3CB72|nr:hypothetical protein [Asticcacaulis sp. YBE204]ESQ78019.1 hypothetical protein AEYBE204_16105 [Asticcacaulis sp. YBE204]
MRRLIAVLLTVYAFPAAADTVTQTVYEGTLGKSPIVLEVRSATVGGKTLTGGRYYYTKYRGLIPLEGRGNGLMDERPYCEDPQCPVTGTFSLKASATGLTGTWTAKGKSAAVPVTLKKVAARNVASTIAIRTVEDLSVVDTVLESPDVPVGDDPFRSRRLNQDNVYGPETVVGPIAYRTVTDKATGVHYLSLTRHPDAAAMKKVNATLDIERYFRLEGALDCLSMKGGNGQGTTGGYDETTEKVVYLTPTLMAVEDAGSTYCGGAHPNNYWVIHTYDLRQGGELDFDRVLKLFNTPAGWKDGDERSETAEYKALQAKLNPKSPWFAADVDRECLGEDVESYGGGYSFSFGAKGLVVSRTDLPHALGACMGVYYVVPYAELKSLWRPEAKAYFPNL